MFFFPVRLEFGTTFRASDLAESEVVFTHEKLPKKVMLEKRTLIFFLMDFWGGARAWYFLTCFFQGFGGTWREFTWAPLLEHVHTVILILYNPGVPDGRNHAPDMVNFSWFVEFKPSQVVSSSLSAVHCLIVLSNYLVSWVMTLFKGLVRKRIQGSIYGYFTQLATNILTSMSHPVYNTCTYTCNSCRGPPSKTR